MMLEMTTETAMVMANCLYITPVIPPIKATGINTAHRTRVVATMGLNTSCMARMAACGAESFRSRMLRSTFSSTTMASSTTMPMVSTIPNRVSRLMEKPSSSMPAKVPIKDTGTAIQGIRVARKFCKKR